MKQFVDASLVSLYERSFLLRLPNYIVKRRIFAKVAMRKSFKMITMENIISIRISFRLHLHYALSNLFMIRRKISFYIPLMLAVGFRLVSVATNVESREERLWRYDD